MNKFGLFSVLAISTFAFALAAPASNATYDQEKSGHNNPEADSFIKSIVGSWEGICRTWFRPG
ncbi:MAG: hypothetical protein AB7T22_16085, partial [Calditrichaceae bacterium]